ncbi:MAG: lysine--tRNA ligase, partial [Phycisphaerales bacterium]|nr:lysine--tRNA ligase [Phycisphaerales bacterium]
MARPIRPGTPLSPAFVDLWTNPQVMRTMKLRIRIVEEIRKYLTSHGFLEVETPMLQPIHGGAA